MALAFEVVSVKPNTLISQATSVAAPPGRFIAINAPLATLLSVAYQLPCDVELRNCDCPERSFNEQAYNKKAVTNG